jgi:hypothetical protein
MRLSSSFSALADAAGGEAVAAGGLSIEVGLGEFAFFDVVSETLEKIGDDSSRDEYPSDDSVPLLSLLPSGSDARKID